MASCQQGKEKDLKHKNKGTMRMGHSPLLRSPIIPLLLPPKIRLITYSYSSFVTFHSGLLFCAHNFHQCSVTLSCIISFCLGRLYQSSPRILFIRINYLNYYYELLELFIRLYRSLYAALRCFTSLYIIFNLAVDSDLVRRL